MINTCRESLSNLKPAENHDQTVPQKKVDMEELEQLERTIVSGLETFKAVDLSLAEIHNRRLYKLRGFSDFGEYCESQFNISRSHGYRQIAHAVTCQNIGENPAYIPEKVVRPLTKIDDPETAQRLWQEVKVESPHEIPTSKEVEHKIFCYENNILSPQQDESSEPLPLSPEQQTLFTKLYANTSVPQEAEPSTEVYCKELDKTFCLQNIAKELIAEIAMLQLEDDTASPSNEMLNRLNKLLFASFELKDKLNAEQLKQLKREYEHLAGEFFDVCMES
ncbi:MAG: hypothetical protein J6W00_06235 [Lentisphaeria bacterium]|nr:hypothetical protein [Lentisphaeria bacterium]